MNTPVQKIVSGGQTGVDRAALDTAIFLAIPHGGWCPAGRRSEDGTIPQIYQLKETTSRSYPVRTEQNVLDSDGTLILYIESMSGGTLLTRKLAKRHHRPCLTVDLANDPDPISALAWIQRSNVSVLNVAGPRESSHPGITSLAEKFLWRLLSQQ